MHIGLKKNRLILINYYSVGILVKPCNRILAINSRDENNFDRKKRVKDKV